MLAGHKRQRSLSDDFKALSTSPGLSFVVVHHVLQELNPLFCLDLVDLDHVVSDCDLQVLPLLIHLLRDLAGRELAPDHPRLLGLLLLHSLEV